MAFAHCILNNSHGSIAVVVQGLLYDVPRSQADTPPSVRLLWTSNQLVAENSDSTKRSQETAIRVPEAFEPTIPIIEWP